MDVSVRVLVSALDKYGEDFSVLLPLLLLVLEFAIGLEFYLPLRNRLMKKLLELEGESAIGLHKLVLPFGLID